MLLREKFLDSYFGFFPHQGGPVGCVPSYPHSRLLYLCFPRWERIWIYPRVSVNEVYSRQVLQTSIVRYRRRFQDGYRPETNQNPPKQLARPQLAIIHTEAATIAQNPPPHNKLHRSLETSMTTDDITFSLCLMHNIPLLPDKSSVQRERLQQAPSAAVW